jgi:predicted TIM-barrel fold metal-dependent hydrolase
LGCLPIFHSIGFTVTVWYPLLRGCLLVTTPSPTDSRALIDSVRDEAANVLIGAPTFIRPLLRKAKSSDLRSLDLVVTGAEKLPEDLRRSFLEAFHIEILQGYGLTETSPVTNVNQPNPPVTTGTADEQIGKKAGTVGRLLPGISARIVHPETGAQVAPGETGILLLRGANVFSHYLGEDPQAHLRDGWFVTWDLASIDEDGFLTVEGRLARFSKIGGEMVPHGAVELKIAEVFGTDPSEALAAVVVGIPDESKGEALAIVTTLELSAALVREKLSAAGLPNLWIPRAVHRVAAIPFLGTGKVDLAQCRRIAAEAKRPALNPSGESGVVDAHIHMYPGDVAADPAGWGAANGEPRWTACVAPQGRPSIQGWADVDKLIGDMDGAGVEASVMLGWYWERQETCDLQNGWYAEWIRRHPTRLRAFAAVQPAGGQRSVDALERALDTGLCGIGELLPPGSGPFLADRWWRRVFEIAAERAVPVTLHASDPEAGPAAGPPTPLGDFLALAAEHPGVNFILAHWGGGLAFREPPGPIPGNLHFDTAASPLLYDRGVFRSAVDQVGGDRIIYGSDYPLILYPRETRHPGFRRFLDEIAGAGLTPAEREAMFSSNIRRLLAAGLAPARKRV